jgi:PhnB protein
MTWETKRMTDSAERQTPVIREVFPYLCVRNAAVALEFSIRVFGAEEQLRLTDAGGRIAYAELRFGPAVVMLVDDVDTLTARVPSAGATVLREPEDHGHGERQSRVRDRFGHEWLLGLELEARSPDEIKRRFDAEQRV